MIHDELRAIQAEMALTQPAMAELIGCSLVGYKRYATGGRPIPAYVARFVVALQLLHKNGMLESFSKAAKKY